MRISCMVGLCAAAFMMALPTDAGAVIENDVMTFAVSGAETYADAIPAGVTRVVKLGAGTLTISGDSETYHGDVEIREGVVVATHRNALGRGSGGSGTTSPNTITVSSGAQLRATFEADKDDGNAEGRGFRSIVRIAGSGPDGSGAFYYDRAASGVTPFWYVWELRLTDDATIGGQSPWFVRRCDLQGHVLTVASPAGVRFHYCTIANPGHIVMANTFSVYGSAFNGGRTNVLELASTAEALWIPGANPIDWSVVWSRKGKATIESNGGGDSGAMNVINGDFTHLGSQLTVWPQRTVDGKRHSVTLNGAVVCSNGYLEKGGDGVFNLGGPSNIFTRIYVSDGELNVRNSETNYAAYLTIADEATVSYSDAGLVAFTNGSCQVFGRFANGKGPGELKLSGATDFRMGNPRTYLYVGGLSGTERTWGTLEIGAGASMSNNFAVGTRGRGAVYQAGGSVYMDAPDVSYSSNLGTTEGGSVGYGYWGMTDGTVVAPRYLRMAYGDGSTAFFVQRGGTATVQGENLKLSVGGHGHMVVANGAIFRQAAGSTYMGFTDGGDGTGGTATLTIAGAETVFTPAWFVGTQNRKNFTAYINVNDGGVFDSKSIVNNAGSGWSWPEGSKEYVSFDGGIWRAPANTGTPGLFYSVGRAAPDRFLCQRGGIVFDAGAGTTMKVNAPLEAPTGKTVKSITLPDNEAFRATRYIGPARIEIVDATGVGATAYAPFDDAARTLRGDVVVMSRGTGYSDATVVRVWSMDGDQSWNCACELEDAVSGGVEKRGPGTLSFVCENTYAGKTSVKEGSLDVASTGTIPNGQPLEVSAGAALNLAAPISATTLEGAGAVKGDVTVTEAYVVDSANFNAGNALTVNGCLEFAAGSKIRAEDVSGLDVERFRLVASATKIAGKPTLDGFGPMWRLRIGDGKMSLGVCRGTVVVLR